MDRGVRPISAVIRLQPIKVYVSAMAVAGITALTFTNWHTLLGLPRERLEGWAALVGIALLSEALAIRLDVGKKPGSSSIMFIPLLASVQLFGPASAMALMLITGVFGEVVRRKDPLRATFNVAQGMVATCVAGWAFTLLGGVPLALNAPFSQALHFRPHLAPFVGYGLVFLALNHTAVALAIALSQQLRFVQIWGEIVGHSGASLQDLLISPIAIAVAYLYVELDIAGILVVFFPILFVRHAYANMLRLRDANRDLLKALIKAIETRDPYTSGHSLRVSHLARSIAELLGLPRGSVQNVEHAALLHDIGKIEAVYTGILMKPEALTEDERAIIESHVTKGEELLRNLSSVPEGVIRAVRHHHEREDGAGYPDGLMGDDIPIGSKIIAVCDAVDAMLSDRPYRRALSIPAVLEQLRRYAGTQFDAAIVKKLVASDLLIEYADVMRVPKTQPPLPSRRVPEIPLRPRAPGFRLRNAATNTD